MCSCSQNSEGFIMVSRIYLLQKSKHNIYLRIDKTALNFFCALLPVFNVDFILINNEMIRMMDQVAAKRCFTCWTQQYNWNGLGLNCVPWNIDKHVVKQPNHFVSLKGNRYTCCGDKTVRDVFASLTKRE